MGALQAGLPTLAAIPGNVYRIIMDLVFGFCFCLFVYLFFLAKEETTQSQCNS